VNELLEARYRKVLMVLPRTYWAEHSEEMLAVLMDGATPGRDRPKAREVLSVGLLAARLRFAVGGARASGTVAGDIARRAILAFLVFDVGLLVELNAYGAGTGYSFLPILLEVGIIVALIRGWIWVWRVLGLAVAAYHYHQDLWWRYGFHYWAYNFGSVTRMLVIAAAIVAFHPGAPRVAGAQRWFLALGGIAAAFWIRGLSVDRQPGFDITHTPVLPALIYCAAMIAAIRQAKASPVWPSALALAGLPVFVPVVAALGSPIGRFGDSARDSIYLGVTVAAEVGLVVAALVSFVVLLKQRRGVVSGREVV
jgi:hypothetical protein